MVKENILAPEIDLIKENEFYLFYEMMIQSLKTDNVREGISKSLMLLKLFLNSSNVAFYIKNQNGSYVLKDSDSPMNELGNTIGFIINKTDTLVKQKKVLNLSLNLSDNLKNLILLDVKLDNNDCVVAIVNSETKELEHLFWDRVCDTMHIILKRAASYERNTKAITMDLLTGLDNRNSYEMRMQKFNEADENLVLGIFDLFRLKYINDNYSHDKGDMYIKKAASILKKYWPKERVTVDKDGSEDLVQTGHCVYRYGGDEFVLLTTSEEISLTMVKAYLSSSEVELISLDIDDKIPVGLNYGIVHHKPGDKIKHTCEEADELMQQNKRKMYLKYNLERRH